jgi:hypothetical protein
METIHVSPYSGDYSRQSQLPTQYRPKPKEIVAISISVLC